MTTMIKADITDFLTLFIDVLYLYSRPHHRHPYRVMMLYMNRSFLLYNKPIRQLFDRAYHQLPSLNPPSRLTLIRFRIPIDTVN